MLSLQVQTRGDPSASGAGGGDMLDGGLHRGAHTHVGLEQPEAPSAERLHQLRPRHHLPVRERHQHGLHGLLQLFRMGAAAAAAHAGDLRRDLLHDPQAAQQQEDHQQSLRSQQVLQQGAESGQIAGSGTLSFCHQLAAPPHHQLHHAVLPRLPEAHHAALHRHPAHSW